MIVVAGDIGGTNARLRLVSVEPTGHSVLAERVYASAEYPDLATIVAEFLREFAAPAVEAGCFAVAGPVHNQQSRITNLPWHLDAAQLSRALAIPKVRLINDFAAVGYALVDLAAQDVAVLQRGSLAPQGVRALIGAGTGLGQAIVVACDERIVVLATEGGHVEFAPRNELEVQLLQYLWRRRARVTYEMLLSGGGLVRLFEFVRDTQALRPTDQLAAAMHAGDPAAAISEFALTERDPLAARALDLFVGIYGAQAGNMALATVPRGGLYIAGGIAPRILERLRRPEFLAAFHAKSPMDHIVREIPVSVVLNTKVGLIGAARLAATLR